MYMYVYICMLYIHIYNIYIFMYIQLNVGKESKVKHFLTFSCKNRSVGNY